MMNTTISVVAMFADREIFVKDFFNILKQK